MYSLGCSYGRSYSMLDVGMPTAIAPQIISDAVWNALPRVGQALDVSPGTLNNYSPGLTSNMFEVFDGDPEGSGVSIYGPESLSNIRAYMADLAQEGAILYLRWSVTNSAGSDTASVASPGAVLPALSAPTATLNVDVTGRVVTAWLTAISGVPTTIPTLDIFTAAGSDVTGSVTGAGTQGNPWRYAVPSSGSVTDIVIAASLDNGVAPAWSETESMINVPSDQATPTTTVALAQPAYADGETVGSADIVPTISTAGNPALQLADLTAILMVDGAPVSLPYTAVEGEVLVPRVTASHPTGAIDVIGNGVTVLPGFSLTENLTDAELEINGATGAVTITMTSPAIYATYNAGNGPGVFTFSGADLASGPVNLVPPQVIDDGTPAEGETLTLTPGLWVYEPDNGGLESANYQWQRNGVDIAGATAASYTLVSADAGTDVRVRESLSDNAGSATSSSAAVSAAAGSGTIVSFASVAADTSTRPGYALYVFDQADSGGTIVFSSGGDVEALAVGSGGGGGNGNTRGGAGGGGGEVVEDLTLTVAATTYTVTVAAGGAGSASGSASSIGALLSAGGGGYGGRGETGDFSAADGGAGSGGGAGGGGGSNSGLGGTSTGTGGNGGGGSTDGANSGAAGGGGGGAGDAGADAVNSTSGGDGGAGLASSITGTAVTYGGGGGGGAKNVDAGSGGAGGGGAGGGIGSAGTNGLGGGGGGGGGGNLGAAGGHGRVIIAVATQ